MFPVETILAVFPSAVEVGNVSLQPLNLYHIMALDVMGIDTTAEVTDAQVMMAAWILTLGPEDAVKVATGTIDKDRFSEFLESVGASKEALVKAIQRVFTCAYKPFVPGEKKEEKLTDTPEGYGWPLEIAESMVSTYGMSFEEAMSMPLSRIYGMLACARVREGGKPGGPDYYERIAIEKLKRIKG